MNPLVPTALDGVLMTISLGALVFAFGAFVSMIRSASLSGWRFLAWSLVVFLVPIIGPAAWFVVRRRERPFGAERADVGS